MISQLICLSCFLAIIICDYKPPVFKIDLDKPPTERWAVVAATYKNFAPLALNLSKKFIPAIARPMIFYLASRINTILEGDLAKEMEGLAKYSEVPIGEIVLFNLIYDFTAFDRSLKACTGIIAQDTSNRIWHGRNMDYEFQPLLKNITIIADFQKGNKTVFTAVTFAFSVGVLTGQQKAFTISLNERYSGYWWFNLAMAILTGVRYPVSFAIREALQSKKTFDEAVGWLSKIHLISPSYIAISGQASGQGAILTRDRTRAADVWFLEPYRDVWYLVQANYDRWNSHTKTDARKEKAEQLLNASGRAALTPDFLYTVMSAWPVCNEETIFSSVMATTEQSSIYEKTFVRD